MKQFFKTMFASALGALIAMGILVLGFVFLLIEVAATAGGSSSEYKPEENTVFRLKLEGTLMEQAVGNPFSKLFGETDAQLAVPEVIKAIRMAKTDGHIKGIYIEAGAFHGGFAGIEAVRRALADFKEIGKFIVSYGDNYTQGAYYLCSVADSLFLNPQGTVALVGLASQGMFFTGLSEKLGIEYNVFKVGTYKSAVEPFLLKQFSDANREQLNSFLGSIWGNLTSAIKESRHLADGELERYIDEGLAYGQPANAVGCHLADALRYRYEAENSVKAMAGQDKEGKLKTADIRKVASIRQKEKKSDNKIAVLYAEGSIADETVSSLTGEQSVITEETAGKLRKLKEDDNVKAVVFRVNSPGGSAYVSEQIWKGVVDLKAEKPVVVSMGDYAASGGYYISCAADKIVAERTTLTGSIGVFGLFPNFAGTFEKVGVTTDIVKTNPYADLGDISRPMREDEKALLQHLVEQTYDLFLTRCADGRGMTKAEIDSVGQGRVWTGEQAVKLGLVDELGGLDTAIKVAAELAGVSDYAVTVSEAPKDFLTKLMEKQLDEAKLSIARSVMGKEPFELFSAIRRAETEEGILARMPFDKVGF